ncbi:MAG: methionine--tRNA ligase [Candidatus Kerfeldbacteria bacterium]|nr:methionine--tRNA ligase [Candidatus Kerfeldbacteria bacterium]
MVCLNLIWRSNLEVFSLTVTANLRLLGFAPNLLELVLPISFKIAYTKVSFMSRFYVTTPIYYVNDKPHLGHAYTTLAADVLARWHRQRGDDVFFLTGTDEHGAKVQQSAEAAGLTPQALADQNAQKFKDAWSALNISYDYFIRTSQAEHEVVVRELLQRVYDAGYIYSGEYEGLYCVGCEKFMPDGELVNGRCPLHPNQDPVAQKEKNYFFKLSAFRDKLLTKLEAGEYKVIPEGRYNEVVGKLKQGLEDISISRNSVEWGVRVPWDESQTIYVWIDALINYYSATQFVPGKKEFWPADVHLLAKDILWFHAVIWEALLLAAELPLPKVVASHGFFTIDGQKMSKSLGNVIDPLDLIKEFGLEATRYLLLSQVPFTIDGDISLARFRERYESDLANGLGNTFSRVTDMIEKFGNGNFTAQPGVITYTESTSSAVENALRLFEFDTALLAIFDIIRTIDGEIEKYKPWNMVKLDKSQEIQPLLNRWGTMLLDVSLYIKPFMPETAHNIEQGLRADKVLKTTPLFPRLSS